MQGCYRARLMLLIFLLSSLLAGQAWGSDSAQLCSGLAGTGRAGPGQPGATAYTVCRGDGMVWCVPPDGEPVVFARVDAPTCLVVDRTAHGCSWARRPGTSSPSLRTGLPTESTAAGAA